MLISLRYRIVVLSMPKCATTAIVETLAPYADIVIRHPTGLKHASYGRFKNHVLPFLEKYGVDKGKLEVVSLMREPLDYLHSWWKYRSRDQLKRKNHPQHANYTGNVSFDEFVEAYLSENIPPYARVGDQSVFLTDRQGRIGPDRVFRYEEAGWTSYFREVFGKDLVFERKNDSPVRQKEYAKDFRSLLSRQYALYDSLRADGRVPKNTLG